MGDNEQDAAQKPLADDRKPLLTFWRLLGLSGLLSICLAGGAWYSFHKSRVECDLAAASDACRASVALEHLVNELVDLNVSVDVEEVYSTIVRANGLRYMVGPYYGFRGGTRKCEVLFRFAKEAKKWEIQGVLLKGSPPAGSTSRYVYGPPQYSPTVPAQIMTGIAHAHNGKSEDWNSYPYRETSRSPEMCYTESIVDHEKRTPAGRSFMLRVPNGVPCDQIPHTAYGW